MSPVSALRTIATFILFFVILDTVVVIAVVGSGAPVPDWMYFAPNLLGSSFYSGVQKLAAQQSLNQASINVYAMFFFYVLAPGVFFALTNLFLGAFAGIPIITFKLAWAFGVPAADIAALTTGTAIFQAMADIFLVDAIFAYVFGRPLLTEMIFGQ